MLKTLRPRVVELGKIKIGKKSSQERTSNSGRTWRAPEKLDHFLITTLERDAAGDLKLDKPLMDQLLRLTDSPDGKLREIPIVLLSDEVEDVLQAQYVYYAGRQVVARSDGETITWLCDPRTGQPLPEPRIAENRNNWVQTATDQKGNRLFKPHGTLNVVIAAGGAASRFGGVYKLRTTSIITIEQIYGGLRHIQALTGGFLRNVPLRLVVRPMEVSPQGKATTVYVCHVELRGADLSEIQRQVVALAQTQLERARELQAVRRDYLALLRAPGEHEAPEEQAEINEEFHPETADAAPVAMQEPKPEPEYAEFEEFPEPPDELPEPPPEPEPAKTAPAQKPAQPKPAAAAKPAANGATPAIDPDSLPF